MNKTVHAKATLLLGCSTEHYFESHAWTLAGNFCLHQFVVTSHDGTPQDFSWLRQQLHEALLRDVSLRFCAQQENDEYRFTVCAENLAFEAENIAVGTCLDTLLNICDGFGLFSLEVK